MPVGRGYKPAEFEAKSQFIPLPLDFMQKQLDASQKKTDEQDALIVDMLGKRVEVNKDDIHGISHAKKLKEDLDLQLNELSGTDLTAPGGTEKIMGVKSKFNKIFTQFGDNDQLKERSGTIESAKKSIADATASPQTKAFKFALLKKGIEESPMGGGIKAPSIVNEVDIPKLMLDVAKEVVADSDSLEQLRVTDPRDAFSFVSKTGKTVTVSRSKLIHTLDNYFKFDPAVAATVHQQAEAFSMGDPDRYKALSNLNVIKDAKGTIDNNSLYGAAMEAALGAKTRAETSTEFDYTENRQAVMDYQASLKEKESDEVLTRTEEEAPTVESKHPESVKEFTEKTAQNKNSIIDELEQAFATTPEKIPAGTTARAMAESNFKITEGNLGQLKKNIMAIFDPSKTPKMLKLIQDKQNLEQLNRDATNYAKAKGANPDAIIKNAMSTIPEKIIASAGNTRTEISREEVIGAIMNNRGGTPINPKEYALIPNASNKDVYVLTKNGAFMGNVDAKKGIRQALEISETQLADSYRKANTYKEEYLKQIKKDIKLPSQFADNLIIPYIYAKDNANPGKVKLVPDLEKGQKITKAINQNLIDGLYDGLLTSDGKTTLGAVIKAENDGKEGSDKVKPSKIRFTTTPNKDGYQELLVNVGDKKVKISSNQIQINDPGGRGMVKLSDLQNTPLDKINRTIFSAYSTGLNKIELEDGIKIDLPAFNKEGVKAGGYVNDSNIVVTIDPKDKERLGDVKDSKLVGQRAIDYLIEKINTNKIIL